MMMDMISGSGESGNYDGILNVTGVYFPTTCAYNSVITLYKCMCACVHACVCACVHACVCVCVRACVCEFHYHMR